MAVKKAGKKPTNDITKKEIKGKIWKSTYRGKIIPEEQVRGKKISERKEDKIEENDVTRKKIMENNETTELKGNNSKKKGRKN